MFWDTKASKRNWYRQEAPNTSMVQHYTQKNRISQKKKQNFTEFRRKKQNFTEFHRTSPVRCFAIFHKKKQNFTEKNRISQAKKDSFFKPCNLKLLGAFWHLPTDFAARCCFGSSKWFLLWIVSGSLGNRLGTFGGHSGNDCRSRSTSFWSNFRQLSALITRFVRQGKNGFSLIPTRHVWKQYLVLLQGTLEGHCVYNKLHARPASCLQVGIFSRTAKN